MVMFQITERKSSIDVACAPEHFDTFFKEIGRKLRGCRPKDCFGGRGSAKNQNFYKTVLFWHWGEYFHDWGVYLDVKWAQQSNFKALKEIQQSVFVKIDVFGQNWAWGRFFRFVAKLRLFTIFEFTDVRRITPQIYSRNLSLLSCFVCP